MMRSRQDLELEPVPGSVLRTRMRVIASLILNGLLLGGLAFVTTPRILDPIMSVPPNRYFMPSQGVMLIAAVAYLYRSGAWMFFLIGLGASSLIWKGRLDRFNRGLLPVLLCSCLGVGACIGYTESLPSWVEKTYGARVRARMFEGPEARLLPRHLFR